MEVKHDASRQEFYVELEGHRAHVAYQIHDEGLDIRHTIVPEAIGGKGIAIQGLSSNAVHNLLFPLPPLKEQFRIVEMIDNTLQIVSAL